MKAIFIKEIWMLVCSWSTWLAIGMVGLAGTLILFYFENEMNLLDIGVASLNPYFQTIPGLLLLSIPALSMRSIAEEEQNGTLRWLFTQPISTSGIILGKYFALLLVGCLCLLPSISYYYCIHSLSTGDTSGVDIGMIFGGYAGGFLLVSGFAATGMLCSALGRTQIIAYLLAVTSCSILYYGLYHLASYRLLGGMDFFLKKIGYQEHYSGFSRGVASFSDLGYFLSMVVIQLMLCIYLVERKKLKNEI